MKKLKSWEIVLLVVVAGLVLGVGASLVTGCAEPLEYHIKINPATGEGAATLTKSAMVEPLTGFQLHAAEVQPPPEGGIWGIIGLALGGSTLLTSLLPKGQAIWSMLFKSGVPATQKVQGAAALVLPAINSPPAAHAITDARRKAAKKKET